MNKAIVVLILVIIGVAAIAIHFNKEEEKVITIFHAGSLAGPFGDLEKKFELQHPGIDVQREVAGSAATIRKVTELGKNADIVASADYTLIQTMMIDSEPKYANYYIQFASNQMVLAYTDASVYNKDMNQTNWFKILMKGGVKFGFSNPNDDPCGYRALMVIQLAEIYYNNDTIFDKLIENNTGIYGFMENGTYSIIVPETPNINPKNKIMMRSAEIDLMALLETGEIDYLFIYKSVAYQREDAGIHFLELPAKIDLSQEQYADFYKQVHVITSSGNITGKPIIYGLTIPKNAENPDLAVEFIEMLLSEAGRDILTKNGQTPITPAICSNKEELPDALKPYVI